MISTIQFKILRAILIAALVSLFGAGCLVWELNVGHYESYFEGGSRALDAEDYPTAKKRFERACFYGQDLGPKAEAAAVYNYGLAVGHLGEFDKAESCFKRALALDAKTDGPDGLYASMRWFELARLYQACGKNELSRRAYEKALPLAEKYGASNQDPIGMAQVLDDYATVLDRLGESTDSAKVREHADSLRKANAGKKPLVKIHYYPSPTAATPSP